MRTAGIESNRIEWINRPGRARVRRRVDGKSSLQMMTGRRAFLAGAAAVSALPAAARLAFKTEIIVRTVTNLHDHEDVSTLIAMAAQHGVSTINLAAKQDEDDEIASGFVFYASRIAPRAPGYETFDA